MVVLKWSVVWNWDAKKKRLRVTLTFGKTFWDSNPPPTLGQFIEGLLPVKYEGKFLNYTKKVSGIWQYHVYAQ